MPIIPRVAGSGTTRAGSEPVCVSPAKMLASDAALNMPGDNVEPRPNVTEPKTVPEPAMVWPVETV